SSRNAQPLGRALGGDDTGRPGRPARAADDRNGRSKSAADASGLTRRDSIWPEQETMMQLLQISQGQEVSGETGASFAESVRVNARRWGQQARSAGLTPSE